MLRTLFLAGLVLLSSAAFPQDTVCQTDETGRKQGYWCKYDKDGFKVYEGRFKDDIPYGKFTYFYQNGKVRTVSILSANGTVARTTSWYRNGKMMARGNYLYQQRDSLWQFFSEFDEVLVSEEFYVEGKKEGEEKVYYPGKGIAEVITWKAGIREGPWKQFYDDGTPKLEATYLNDEREGPVKTYFVTGQVLSAGHYKNGHQDGTWMFYDDKGSITLKEFYNEGILVKKEEFNE